MRCRCSSRAHTRRLLATRPEAAALDEARAGEEAEAGSASGTRLLLEALHLQRPSPRPAPALEEDAPSLPSRRSSLGSAVSGAALSLRLPDDLLTPSQLRQLFRRRR